MTQIHDPRHIEQLLDRFFDGETTLAEERELQTYFTTASTIPDRLAPTARCLAGMPQAWTSSSSPRL